MYIADQSDNNRYRVCGVSSVSVPLELVVGSDVLGRTQPSHALQIMFDFCCS